MCSQAVKLLFQQCPPMVDVSHKVQELGSSFPQIQSGSDLVTLITKFSELFTSINTAWTQCYKDMAETIQKAVNNPQK